MSTQLIKYEAACRALAECKSVDEVKAWADKAAAMQAYGRMAKDKTLEVDAAEIRIRAERRLGEMISAQKSDGGLNKGKLKQGPVLVSNEGGKRAPKLADVGIGYDLSSRAQKLAAVPEAEFEAELAAKRERDQKEGARVSAKLEKAGERELAKAKQPSVKEPDSAADTGQSLDELIAEIQKENEQLHAQLKAMEAEDTKAELRKALFQRDHAIRQQSEAMDRAAREHKAHAFKHRQLMRCGKAVGEDDPDKIAAAVEAFARQRRVA